MLDVLRGSEGGGGGGGGSHWLGGMDSGAGSARSSTSENAGGGRSNGRPPHHGSTRSGRHKHRLDDSLDVSGAVTSGGGEPGPDVLEVQIVPQDSWADTTAVTGNTSDVSTSVDDFRVLSAPERSLRARCRRRLLIAFAGTIAALAVLSPVVMVALPRAGALGLTPQQLQCGAECDGALIAFAFKLVILTAGGWAVFVRPARASLPRVFALRAGVLALTFIFTLSYWLFFFVRVLEERHTLQLYTLTVFAGSLVDTLLWTHYLAVLLLELRHTTPHYAVRVVRSPDGESRLYPLGTLSVQRAAAHVLERYYTDFPVYNPYLERLPTKTASRKTSSVTSYKYYDVDGSTGGSTVQTPVRLPASRRKDASHNERFYEESEYERRVKKRRSRLVTAAEEAFTHIKRLQDEHGPALPMDPHEAAQAIFPTMARPLQKYLRVTRQQPRHTMEAILAHLAQCLAHDLAPRAFLERYLTPAPVLEAERADRRGEQNWALVSETSLARSAVEGVVFQLRQHDVSLLCTVVNLPHFNLSEEIIDPKCNKFVLRLNSETSV